MYLQSGMSWPPNGVIGWQIATSLVREKNAGQSRHLIAICPGMYCIEFLAITNIEAATPTGDASPGLGI